jgi:hypothetical protein
MRDRNKSRTLASEISPSDLLIIPDSKDPAKRLTKADMSVRLSHALGNIKRKREDSFNSFSDLLSN